MTPVRNRRFDGVLPILYCFSMDSLYSRLAAQWDTLFPPDPGRVSFLLKLFNGSGRPPRLIEVGCGTAATAIALARSGCSVAASDLDPVMIDAALNACPDILTAGSGLYFPAPGRIRLAVEDMLTACERAPQGSADGVLCLGNTLPHLTRSTDLTRFFYLVGQVLVPRGILVVQILNFPGIIKAGGIDLPDLKGDGILFRRRHHYIASSGLIEFHTEVESPDRVERRVHALNPIVPDDLNETAAAAGFQPEGVYSNWNGTAYKPDSAWLAVIWRKIVKK